MFAGGKDKVQELARQAVASGRRPKEQKMETPLKISGVGEGVQECKWETFIPVAIPDGEGGATLFDLQTPVVGGSGSHLPIIVGLKTMSDKMGVLEMGEGKERLAFPGPGGYKIEWSPWHGVHAAGTRVFRPSDDASYCL